MKTQNVDLKPFEKSPAQQAYEQATAQWQQVVMEMAKQGVDPKQYPPQPTPQAYGYQPGAPASQQPQQQAGGAQIASGNVQTTGGPSAPQG